MAAPTYTRAMSALRSSAYRQWLVPWLIALLLVAQGVRICVPAASPGEEPGAAHLESVITNVADHHQTEAAGYTDLSLQALLFKLFDGSLAVGALLLALPLLVLFSLSSTEWRRDATRVSPSCDSCVTPPLRAPPR